MKVVDAKEAVNVVHSGYRVFLHEASMTPVSLVEALCARREELTDVEVVHLHTEAPAPYAASAFCGHIRHNALFVGGNVRAAVEAGYADYTPVFLSEVPLLFEDGEALPLDVAFVQMSPPDRHGFCRLGLSVAAALSAVKHARIVVAELNPQVPLTAGNTAVHMSEIDYAVEVDRKLPEFHAGAFGDTERAIGNHVASLVDDGSTIQVGIGNIPNAVLDALRGHSDLGVHTEMMSDGLVALMTSGAVNNRKKTRFERRSVTSFAMGSRALLEFVDQNPFVEFHPSDVVNDPNEIGKQHSMVAINSAIEIDLTGQVCADSIGERIFSGIGGQMDFVQGAHRSAGGKAIIALSSTAKNGAISRIVPRLQPGAGVVTTRGHVQWVVTEHGAVNLRGRTLKQRAEQLISVADPAHRGALVQAARNRKLFT